jgi:hypothetical protein
VIFFLEIIVLFPKNIKADEVFQIDPEVQATIEQAVKDGNVSQEYVDGVIDLFYKNIHTNSEDLNMLLIDSVKGGLKIDAKTDVELDKALAEEEKLKEISPRKRNAVTAAKSAYQIGISMVQKKGCPMTAAYMQLAAQKSPGTSTSKNNAWAKKCALNDSLFMKLEEQFEREILSKNKAFGTVTGTFAYTKSNSSLDQFAALHNVNYSVTFTKKSNGYAVVYNISDVYDFAWGNYDSFAVGFGNNYCYAMQTLGLIKSFKINIIYTS